MNRDLNAEIQCFENSIPIKHASLDWTKLPRVNTHIESEFYQAAKTEFQLLPQYQQLIDYFAQSNKELAEVAKLDLKQYEYF